VPRNTTVVSLSKPTAASTLRIALGAAPQQHGCRYMHWPHETCTSLQRAPRSAKLRDITLAL
jgi:hypothetical protein